MAIVQKDIGKWQPDWVALRILDFARKVHEFGNDDKALAEWTRQMSEDLIFNNTSSEDEFTQNLLAEASDAYAKKSKAGRKGGIAKARNQKQKSQEVAGNGNAPDVSGNSLEEFNDQENASGNYQVPDKVSTNNGDDPHGDDGDDRRYADNGDTVETITASEPFAMALDKPGPNKDKATAKTRDNSSSCRHASPSCSPEDGTIDTPVTDGDICEDSLNMPEDRNVVMMEPRTSVAGDSFGGARERSQRPGEGRKTLSAGSSHPAGNTSPQFVINHNQRHRPQKPQANSPPRSSEDVRLFAIDRNLDIDDARMWYQMNFVDRPGCDKDGVAINNWKGHCTAYCKAEAERRKAG